jgi:N-acylneuraminate cytidylyltransferase
MDNMVKNICIIPARGGSKRIPKKNIIDFNGKPMIAYSIEAAKKTKLFDRLIVSTDDNEIANISKKYGAEVPFLRKKTADDHSPISLATLEALEQAEKYYDENYANVVQLMANTPLRTSEDIINQFDYFEDNKCESLISHFKYGWMNPWWAIKIDEKGYPKKIFDDLESKRSQDLPDLFCPTGATWISKIEVLKKYKTFYSPKYEIFELDWKNSVDIDNYNDLDFAKLIFSEKNEKSIKFRINNVYTHGKDHIKKRNLIRNEIVNQIQDTISIKKISKIIIEIYRSEKYRKLDLDNVPKLYIDAINKKIIEKDNYEKKTIAFLEDDTYKYLENIEIKYMNNCSDNDNHVNLKIIYN